MAREKILLAADSRTNRAWLESILSEWGYQVIATDNGTEARNILQSPTAPGLAILDWEMPGLNGVEVCQRARNRQNPLPQYFIMLSSKDEGANIATALKTGADDYITKPVNLEELQARIHVGLRLLTMQRQLAHNVAELNQVLTERDLIEQTRRQVDAENEQILSSISAILIGVDEHDQVTQWNNVAEETFGIQSSTVLQWPLISSGVQWDWPEVLAAIATCHDSPRPIRLNDVRYHRPDGKDGVLSLTINPITTHKESPEPQGILLLGEDMTDHRLLERQLVQAQKLESIGQLAAGIAHEINTPIQYVGDNTRFLEGAFTDLQKVLDQFTHLLNENKKGTVSADCFHTIDEAVEDADLEFLTEEIPKAIAQSIEGVERIATIVRAMKEFSHPGVEEKTAIDINKAIDSTITISRNEWKYVADMVTSFDEQLPLIPCFPGELNQVILNIIVNAAHAIADAIGNASKSKGRITILTRRDEAWAEIRITDTGTGIPEKAQHKIFDPFFTTKEVGRGTGQGLAISHSVITEKHEGAIYFETEIGKGTSFIIRLPLGK